MLYAIKKQALFDKTDGYTVEMRNGNEWLELLEFAALSYTKDITAAKRIAEETYEAVGDKVDYFDREDQRLLFAAELSHIAIKYLKQEILEDNRKKQMA